MVIHLYTSFRCMEERVNYGVIIIVSGVCLCMHINGEKGGVHDVVVCILMVRRGAHDVVNGSRYTSMSAGACTQTIVIMR